MALFFRTIYYHQRYNSVLRGLANYYTEFVGTPGKSLSRWFYIIRYSCLKTLAQKYHTSLKQIFKKFPLRGRAYKNYFYKSRLKTIACTVQQTIEGSNYEKTWILMTNNELIGKAKDIQRLKTVSDRYWTRSLSRLPKVRGFVPFCCRRIFPR